MAKDYLAVVIQSPCFLDSTEDDKRKTGRAAKAAIACLRGQRNDAEKVPCQSVAEPG